MTDTNENPASSDNTNYHFIEITNISEIPPGERIFVEIENTPIVIINNDGKLYAIEDKCTHDNGPLGDGEIEHCNIICPRHGARFDMQTGKALTLPAFIDIKTFPINIKNEMIYIGIPT